MGVQNSEVGYNSATARRGDQESSYEHVVALEKNIWGIYTGKGLAQRYSNNLISVILHAYTAYEDGRDGVFRNVGI